MTTVVSLNGAHVPPEQAVVSVFDRGFLYGDSVYEVIRTYRGVPFEMEAHLSRLAGSAERLAMALPVPLETIAAETIAAHRSSKNAESYLRIVVTRGSGEIGLDIALAKDPMRIVIVQALKPLPKDVYETGATISLVSVRRNLREAVDPLAKTGNYLNSILALAEARRKGGIEAVMLDHQGHVTEGASSNVFAAKGGVLMTPPLEVGLLKGITRDVIFEAARRAGIRVVEAPIDERTLRSADEVFITSSIREIVPVARIDDTLIGGGKPGPLYPRLRSGFDALVAEYVLARIGAKEEWLKAFVELHKGVAGTVHRLKEGVLVLESAMNIPPPVQEATRRIPRGKGMAGLAWERNEAVTTCNLKTDESGAVKPGARAVDAQAAIAIPVASKDGSVCAVVGVAFPEERAFEPAAIARLSAAARTLPAESP
jgi:branched-chain amino acid aminotransferase